MRDGLTAFRGHILDVAKLEAGKVEIEIVDFNLETMVEDVVEALSAQAADKSLEIAAFVDAGARRILRGDPSGCAKSCTICCRTGSSSPNRASSTSKSARGRTATAGPLCASRCATPASEIPSEARPRLFQKFQQAETSVTRRFGGPGLGLSISRQLVELMGGRIDLEDRPGGGSLFWIELTLDDGAATWSGNHPADATCSACASW